jgi:uncharacterized protein (TIGR03085 family)
VTSYAAIERDALADLLLEVGPDAPTLCTGWNTRDLAAHLVVRASRPDAAAGIALKPFASYLARVQRKAAAQEWTGLVAKVRRPPVWAVFGEELVNRTEYFVHHEDIRRAQPGWQPRSLPAPFSAALWSGLRAPGRLALRRTPAAVRVSAPGYGSFTGGRGGPAVELTGEPQELVLFLTGRQAHTRGVELTGPEEIVSRMRTAHYGV